MNLPTRLPKASTLLYQASREQPAEQQPEPAASPSPVAAGITVDVRPQLLELLAAARARDTYVLFTGGSPALQEQPGLQDLHLPHNLRTLEADLPQDDSLDWYAARFRGMCDAAIAHFWHAGNRTLAQYASDFLDAGNVRLVPLERSSGAGARPQPVATPPGARRRAGKGFWSHPPGDLLELLQLHLLPSAPVHKHKPKPKLKLQPAQPVPTSTSKLLPHLPAKTASQLLPQPTGTAPQPPQLQAKKPLVKLKRPAESGSEGVGAGLVVRKKKKAVSTKGAVSASGRAAPELSARVQCRLAQLLELVDGREPASAAGDRPQSAASQASGPSGQGEGAEAPVQVPLACRQQAAKVRASHAAEAARPLSISFAEVSAQLRGGRVADADSLAEAVMGACRSAVERYAAGGGAANEGGLRRGKLLSAADHFGAAVNAAIQVVVLQFTRLTAAGGGGGSTRPPEPAPPPRPAGEQLRPMPESILANKEPYRQGEWRKKPYSVRPYVQLDKYDIHEERELLEWKLSTRKAGGCDGQHCTRAGELGRYRLHKEAFETGCTCLARNTECDGSCACAPEACLNRAVTQRRTLLLGKDIEIVNAWGMDCYTRRNILDAVLESQALGPYKPTYTSPGAPAPGEVLRQPTPPPGAVLQNGGTPGSGASARSGGSRGASAADGDVREAAAHWLEQLLLPAVHRQGSRGWDILAALQDVRKRAPSSGNPRGAKAANAVTDRVRLVGHDYFRLHPKGVGLVCKRPGGLPPLTFVEEYLGEMHSGWRWFEIQDAIKKCSREELPDFYNIVLERPKDDPTGYDCLFIDAASKGAFASRMSHSCTPNCQAVVMACGGRLTIAVYTLRHVNPGEELTFDYASVTESEREFRAATCLCGSRNCRGSFLYFAGSRAFQQVMNTRHTMLHRQALLLRCTTERLAPEERASLHAAGLRESALGRLGTDERVPEWLEKWTALMLAYCDEEQRLLPAELLALRPPLAAYTPAGAAAEAKGVRDNRLQNIVITLDKVKLFLRTPGQLQTPPLRLLTDAEMIDYVWSGEKSLARRALRAAAPLLANPTVARALAAATCTEELGRALERYEGLFPHLQRLGAACLRPAATPEEARVYLREVADILRQADVEDGGGHTAAADLLTLHSATRTWFTAERAYKGFASPPVAINLDDMSVNREATDAATAAALQNVQPLGHAASAGALASSSGADGSEPQLGALDARAQSLPLNEGAEQPAAGRQAGWDGSSSAASEEQLRVRNGCSNGSTLPPLSGAAALDTDGLPSSSPALAAGSHSETGPLQPGSGQPNRAAPLPKAPPEPPPRKRARLSKGLGKACSGDLARAPTADSDEAVAAIAAAAGAGAAAPAAVAAGTQNGGGGGGGESRTQVVDASGNQRQVSVMSKRYGPWFMWGQLNGWYKQTVYDPAASLSAERRGTLSLPDLECCYGGSRTRFTAKDREGLLDHLEKRPEGIWKIGTMWTFRNEAKIYGSPMFDAVWASMVPGAANPMPQVLADLRAAPVPAQLQRGAPSAPDSPPRGAKKARAPPTQRAAAPALPAAAPAASECVAVPQAPAAALTLPPKREAAGDGGFTAASSNPMAGSASDVRSGVVKAEAGTYAATCTAALQTAPGGCPATAAADAFREQAV